MPLRVVQWTTGNVGRRALAAILAHPALELVGVYAHAAEKRGRDAGELCGLGQTGVVATDDATALLALAPDCISYNPLWPEVGELARFLEAGVDVVSTAAFITGRGLGSEAVARLEAACRRGGATLFGTGVNPGFANLFALTSAAVCDRVDRIRVLESVDATSYASAETQQSVGFGVPVSDPSLAARAERATLVFGDAVAMMADALALELDAICFRAEFARATADIELGFMRIAEGCVAGVKAQWEGVVAGRSVIELQVVWKMGAPMEPDFPLRHGYFVEIEGRPRVKSQFQIFPPRDWSEPDYLGLGMIMTAMPGVNAIPAVCAARPGIVTYAELPLVTAAHLVSR